MPSIKFLPYNVNNDYLLSLSHFLSTKCDMLIGIIDYLIPDQLMRAIVFKFAYKLNVL